MPDIKNDELVEVEVIATGVIHKRETMKPGDKIKVNQQVANWLKKEKRAK